MEKKECNQITIWWKQLDGIREQILISQKSLDVWHDILELAQSCFCRTINSKTWEIHSTYFCLVLQNISKKIAIKDFSKNKQHELFDALGAMATNLSFVQNHDLRKTVTNYNHKLCKQ